MVQPCTDVDHGRPLTLLSSSATRPLGSFISQPIWMSARTSFSCGLTFRRPNGEPTLLVVVVASPSLAALAAAEAEWIEVVHSDAFQRKDLFLRGGWFVF